MPVSTETGSPYILTPRTSKCLGGGQVAIHFSREQNIKNKSSMHHGYTARILKCHHQLVVVWPKLRFSNYYSENKQMKNKGCYQQMVTMKFSKVLSIFHLQTAPVVKLSMECRTLVASWWKKKRPLSRWVTPLLITMHTPWTFQKFYCKHCWICSGVQVKRLFHSYVFNGTTFPK